METVIFDTIEKTEAYARAFVKNLVPQKNGATVVCLFGDLGSGKTTFTQSAARALGIKDVVTSPTFVIEKKYPLEHSQFKMFYHIDAYRLEGGGELLALGWNEIVNDPQNIIFIEWPKYVKEVLPQNAYALQFTFVDDHTRKLEIG